MEWALDPARHAVWLSVLYAGGLRVALLTAVLATAAVLLRSAPAATRALLWSLGILGLLLLPAMRLLPAGWPANVLPSGAASVLVALGSAQVAAKGGGAAEQGLASAGAVPLPGGLHWTTAVLLVWLAGACWVCLGLARGWLETRRSFRAAERVTDPEWLAALRDAARELGIRRPVRLLRDPASTTPLTWGTFRPVIALPCSADRWPAAHRRAVLLHELAHVARRDCLLQVMSRLACALYWYHPAAWWIASRLTVERELACDDRVLSAGMRRSDYAECLLRISDAVRQGPGARHVVAVSAGMARPSRLRERLQAVLESGRSRGGPTPATAMLMLGTALLLLLPIGSARLAPTSAVLVEALRDSRWETRAYAAGILQLVRDPATAAALAQAASTDPNALVRRRAAGALCAVDPAHVRVAQAADPATGHAAPPAGVGPDF